MNYSDLFLGNKSDALRLDVKTTLDSSIKHVQVELLAKILNPGNLKLQTPNRKR